MILSIITINFNNSKGLISTIQSVFSQKSVEFEYIIIDGDSSDGSKEYLLSLNTINCKILIEKDNGIYDAMNKGLKIATSDFIFFLNSGDQFLSTDSLYKLLKNGKINDTESVYYFDGYMTENGYIKRKVFTPSKITLNQFFNSTVPHSGFSIIPKKLFLRYGSYNTEIRYCSDWDHFLKLFLNGIPFVKIPDVDVSFFEMGGASYCENAIKEREQLIFKYQQIFSDHLLLNRFISREKKYFFKLLFRLFKSRII